MIHRIVILRVKRWVQPELDRTMNLLKDVRQQLEKTSHENRRLNRENATLRQQVTSLESDVQELRKALRREEEKTATMQDMLARMEQQQQQQMRELNKATAIIESLSDRIYVLEVERGTHRS